MDFNTPLGNGKIPTLLSEGYKTRPAIAQNPEMLPLPKEVVDLVNSAKEAYETGTDLNLDTDVELPDTFGATPEVAAEIEKITQQYKDKAEENEVKPITATAVSTAAAEIEAEDDDAEDDDSGEAGFIQIANRLKEQGFITDIPLSDVKTALTAMLGGAYEEDHRALMRAKVWRDGHCVFNALALNDVVVNRGATSGMLEVRVAVDGRFVANQRADGLIIATPTGSTAYSLSVGGPLMHPGIGGWVMAPIAPHTLSNRPIVLPESCEISIEIVSGRYVSANFDMQSLADLILGDRIVVQRSEHKVRFLHPAGWNYFDTLRKKMHWNEGA